jgi:hypothetical protein
MISDRKILEYPSTVPHKKDPQPSDLVSTESEQVTVAVSDRALRLAV